MGVAVETRTDSLNVDHGMRRQAIVESILHDVFSGQLRAGQHLVTQELADRFGVSHTPIREAIITLSGIGVIDLVPNRGAIVRRVTPKDVREICQVRRALECEAVRRACGRLDVEQLESLRKELQRLTAGQYSYQIRKVKQARKFDSRLHDLIAARCGNRFLAKELGRLKILFRAFRDMAWEHDEARNDFHRLAKETAEHLTIVEALLAGDRRAASRAMSQHIRAGERYWSHVLSETDV